MRTWKTRTWSAWPWKNADMVSVVMKNADIVSVVMEKADMKNEDMENVRRETPTICSNVLERSSSSKYILVYKDS